MYMYRQFNMYTLFAFPFFPAIVSVDVDGIATEARSIALQLCVNYYY